MKKLLITDPAFANLTLFNSRYSKYKRYYTVSLLNAVLAENEESLM